MDEVYKGPSILNENTLMSIGEKICYPWYDRTNDLKSLPERIEEYIMVDSCAYV